MSKLNVVYTKVTEADPAVLALAKATGAKVSEVVTLVNGQRYRSAYNKLRNQEMSALRKLVKENPELLKEVK